MLNRTTIFIIPLIIDKTKDLNDDNSILTEIKGYLGVNKFEHKNEIFIIINKKFTKIIDNLRKKDNFVGISNTQNEVIILLKIPQNLIDDFYKFIIGNYIDISLKSKRKIYRYWINTDNKNIENISFNTLFNYNDIRELILEDLLVDPQIESLEKKNLRKALIDVKEVNSIPKLSDELYLIK